MPFFIRLQDDEPYAFAALWEPASGEIPPGYLILTTTPNSLMESIHNRMPVIVRPEDYDKWLSDAALEPADVESVFVPYPAELMTADAITPLVNSPRNDSPETLSRRP